MRSTQVLTVLALLATSASAVSIGHSSNQLVHRRHANEVTHDAVLQARGARQRDMSGFAQAHAEFEAAKRDVPRQVRKRGINQRRCAPKSSSSAFPSSSTSTSTLAPVANVGPDSTSSSTSPEPTTTSFKTTSAEAYVQPTTTKTTSKAKTSTTAKASETPSSNSGGSSGSSFTGEGTFYGTGLGACGITNTDTDYICAVSQLLFDGFEGYTGGDPNSNPICGRKIKATYQGKSVTVTVTDRCVGCAKNDLDFSPKAFDQIADEALGRLTGLTWVWA